MINLGQEKAARRRVGEVLAEDELDVEAAFDVGGVLYEGGREVREQQMVLFKQGTTD